MPQNNRKITFLSDVPPLKSKGSGISVLLFNILVALEKSYDLNVITFCRETSASTKEILKDNEEKQVLLCDRRLIKLYHFMRFGVFKKTIQFLSFLFSLPQIISQNNNTDSTIITLVGASIRPVYKAKILMFFVPKAKHFLYIVDDLELINRVYNNKIEIFLSSIFLKRTIKQSDVLVTISEGLRELYLKEYGKDSIILPPHYKKVNLLKPKTSQLNNEFTFLFTGGLNVLYNDSLKVFASILEKVNQQNDNSILFKLCVQTYSSYSDFEQLKLSASVAKYSTSDNRDELLNTYQQCDCFLIPYSFSSENHGLVATSFPQKTAEIIQYGKPVLIFGPRDSSVVEFFNANELNYVCSNPSEEDLVKVVLQISRDYRQFDHNSYLEAYQNHLSGNAVTNILKSIIN
jgi:hypothetical protein